MFSDPVFQTTVPAEPFYSQSEYKAFKASIKDLISTGAVSLCQPCAGQYISSIFLVPKPNGKQRFILNLKQLNKFIPTKHFKLEDLRTALKLLSNNCFMSTIDLKDAYFLISIHPNSKKYLRFQFNGNLYEFNVLPFGLNTAPYIFTKILKPIAKLLRSLGYLSTFYLDDLFLVGQSYTDCLQNVNDTIQLLKSLGFIINTEKSSVVPNNCCKFLGNIIDSKRFEVRLPDDKRKKIETELLRIRKLKRFKIRDFARFIGLLTSACQAVDYGWLHTKDFERCKYLNLKDDGNYDKFMNLPIELSPIFDWWLNAIKESVCKIKVDTYSLEIFSDASTTGWGAACGDETASGPWSQHEQILHINYLEILAAFLGLKVFAKDLKN